MRYIPAVPLDLPVEGYRHRPRPSSLSSAQGEQPPGTVTTPQCPLFWTHHPDDHPTASGVLGEHEPRTADKVGGVPSDVDAYVTHHTWISASDQQSDEPTTRRVERQTTRQSDESTARGVERRQTGEGSIHRRHTVTPRSKYICGVTSRTIGSTACSTTVPRTEPYPSSDTGAMYWFFHVSPSRHCQ